MSLYPYKIHESSFIYGLWWQRTQMDEMPWTDFERRFAIMNKREHAKQVMGYLCLTQQ